MIEWVIEDGSDKEEMGLKIWFVTAIVIDREEETHQAEAVKGGFSVNRRTFREEETGDGSGVQWLLLKG